ncbi:alpha/beta hydrolase [Micromonospora sp. NPDC049171]|uniref:alpha/beta hydrolase n=1 Tax=Micromonospora sp. NPDC049171 TaxID=3155770 RepID=UPI0033E76274
MPMDPQVEALRRQRLTDRRPPLYEMSLQEARIADLADIRAGAGTPEPVAGVLDREIPGPGGPLPIRIYRPSGAGPFPVLAYFYGGGWTLGNLDTSDAICRSLTNGVGCVTVSVGYRLAPEHRYPAAVHDCHAAVRWIAAHAAELEADPGRIAVGGDSAGGNLAAAVTLLARDDGGPSIAAQLLVYPNTDYRSDTPSMRQNDDDAFFNRRSVDWYWSHYLADPADGDDPLVSPLRAQDLSGLPAALVITAEYDPLRDQGEQYADRLRDSGVPVELTRYPGMVHGFFAMGGVVDAGARAVRQAVDWLAGRLHGTPGHRGAEPS